MFNVGQLVGGIFGGVGALMFLIGLIWWIGVKKFLSSAVKATGQVTALVPRASRSSGSSTMTSITYAPSVRFQTAGGQQVDFVSKVSSSGPSEKVGDSVEVLYLENNPQKAKINKFTSLWLGPMIMLFIGVLFGGIGGVVWFAI